MRFIQFNDGVLRLPIDYFTLRFSPINGPFRNACKIIEIQAAGGIYEELGDDRLGNFGGGLTPTPATTGTASATATSVRNGGEVYYATGSTTANYAGAIVVQRHSQATRIN